MQINDSLIRQFINRQCDKETAARVYEYLVQHPEQLNALLESDWKEAGEQQQQPPYDAEALLQSVMQHTQRHQLPVQLYRVTAVAAAVCIAMVTSYWLYNSFTAKQTHTVAQQTVHNDAAVWQQISNTQAKPMQVQLPDESVAVLQAGAQLRYRTAFSATERNLYMKGAIRFTVAADKARPFTVFSGEMATTAIGTAFTINTSERSTHILLHSGKVVVRSVSALPGWTKDIYLQPGSYVQYDYRQHVLTLHQANTPATPATKPLRTAAANDTGTPLFDNTPLQDVFAMLGSYYHTTITYTNKDIRHMYFSGHVLPSDSLATILQVITRMNGLEAVPTGNGWHIQTARLP